MTWRPEWDESRPRLGFGGKLATLSWTVRLILACAVTTLVEVVATRAGATALAPSKWLGVRPANAVWLYPWLSHVLPHSPFDLGHLFFNMLLLWLLGSEIEVRLGRSRFFTLFFTAAVVGALVHFLAYAWTDAPTPGLIGASGGIFGLLFFLVRESPHRTFYLIMVPLPAWVVGLASFAWETHPLIMNGLSGGLGDNVAHVAHLGGAAFGFWWCRHQFDVGSIVARLRSSWRERAATQSARRAATADAEMDRLLEKIHEHGMPSLTDSERRFLDRRSRSLRGDRR